MSNALNDEDDKLYSTVDNTNHIVIDDGPILTQKLFDKVFIPTAYEDRTPVIVCRQIRAYIHKRCIPSKQCGQSYVKMLFPFLSWLKTYQIAWLPDDIICGITVAIMQIPQGMAYALLARLPAIIGLYVSFFPPLVYALFGTSRHLSIGAIAVISLMTGNVVDRLGTQAILSTTTTTTSDVLSNITTTVVSNNPLHDPSYAITIATTLAFTVGIIQLLLCIFHLGFVTSFLSDSFISGYTSGTAILVFTSQVPDLLGLRLKRNVGPLNIVYTYIQLFNELKNINTATLTISICSIVTLIVVKEYIEPAYKKQIKKIKLFRTIQIPIPVELIVIIAGTLVSYFLNLHDRHQVRIVHTIGRGFRSPQIPSFILIPALLKDAIIIAVVSFAICMSLAKTYAKKFKYTVHSNQELAAYGLCNIIGSFFSSYSSAGSLSRTSVFVNVGGHTQFASLISCAFLLIIILRIGSLFETLPKACLASIIVVALKGLFLQIKDIYIIGRVAKLEAIVWMLTFSSTILLGVDYGLIIGILTSLLVVILHQFRPRTTILGPYRRDETYENNKRYSSVNEIPRIKIFRFESSITYFNAEYFRHRLLHTVGIDLKNNLQRIIQPRQSLNLRYLTDIIIDCSSINQFDYTGGKIFLQTIHELNDCQYQVYLCNLAYYNNDLLEKLQMKKICSVTIVATVRDAVRRIEENALENEQRENQCENINSSSSTVRETM